MSRRARPFPCARGHSASLIAALRWSLRTPAHRHTAGDVDEDNCSTYRSGFGRGLRPNAGARTVLEDRRHHHPRVQAAARPGVPEGKAGLVLVREVGRPAPFSPQSERSSVKRRLPVPAGLPASPPVAQRNVRFPTISRKGRPHLREERRRELQSRRRSINPGMILARTPGRKAAATFAAKPSWYAQTAGPVPRSFALVGRFPLREPWSFRLIPESPCWVPKHFEQALDLKSWVRRLGPRRPSRVSAHSVAPLQHRMRIPRRDCPRLPATVPRRALLLAMCSPEPPPQGFPRSDERDRRLVLFLEFSQAPTIDGWLRHHRSINPDAPRALRSHG